jgi:hypothetical protein
MLRKFSQIEADSAWQMIHAIDFVEDPAYKASLLLNALEEYHHSDLFEGASKRYKKGNFAPSQIRRNAIVKKQQDLLYFQVFHYVGEKSIYETFYAYAMGAKQPYLKELFLQIRGDEYEHQKNAYKKLQKEIDSPSRLRLFILKVNLFQLSRSIRKKHEYLIRIISYILLTPFYFLFGPLLKRKSQNLLLK